MLLLYIRHADPIYSPDSITPLGEQQAEAIGRRIAKYGVDEIYSSTSIRAQMTAKPAAELLKKEVVTTEIFLEDRVYQDFAIPNEEGKNRWFWVLSRMKQLLLSPEVLQLGLEWYKHPELARFEKGFLRIYDELDEFLLSKGYAHERGTGKYKIVEPSKKRVAVFAHAGYGIAFLSCLLDIPFPLVVMHFDLQPSGMIAINFENAESGYCAPRILTYSNDGHLYAENIPANRGRILF